MNPIIVPEIVEVYEDNFFTEMEKISQLVSDFSYISMVSRQSNNDFILQDTEFPGDIFEGSTHVMMNVIIRLLVLDDQRKCKQLETNSTWNHSQQ